LLISAQGDGNCYRHTMGEIATNPQMVLMHWAQVNQNLAQVRTTIRLLRDAITQQRARREDTETGERVLATMKDTQVLLERIRLGISQEMSQPPGQPTGIPLP